MPPPEDPLPDSYTLHPLRALDGVLIYCTLHGETVATVFGTDEREAAEALASRLPDVMSNAREASE